MTRIRVDYYGMSMAKDKRHAQEVVKDLGIEYTTAQAHPIADCWIFDGVDPETVPKNLPEFVEVLS